MSRLSTTSQFGETGARGFVGSGRVDRERMFHDALRHSRRVRVLRIAIPAGVILVLLGLFAASWFNPLRLIAKLPKELGNLAISGTKITMEQPRMTGYTRDSRAYEFTARAAAQDITKPEVVELQGIRAKVELQDKSVMEMTAATGLYDTKSEILTLGVEITLRSSGGYEGRLSEAVIDTRKGEIVSDKPVELKMLNGTLNANRLVVIESGALIRFDNGVAMTLMLDDAADGSKAGSP
jgi:lipopolysaccharide export system protein LptC